MADAAVRRSPWHQWLLHSAAAVPARLAVAGARAMNSPAELSDEALVLSIRRGRHDLTGELVRRHSDRLFHLLLRLVHSRSAAEDLLQDTWISVMRKLRHYDANRPFRPWVTRIAVNRCRDHWRRERLRRLWPWTRSGDGESDPIEQLPDGRQDGQPETPVIVQQALMGLSPKLRETVVLKFFSGLTHDEIAAALGAPPGTVKRRLQLALAKLREQLGEEVTA